MDGAAFITEIVCDSIYIPMDGISIVMICGGISRERVCFVAVMIYDIFHRFSILFAVTLLICSSSFLSYLYIILSLF